MNVKTRVWPRVVAAVIVLGLGAFFMGTEVGNAQWIVGLIISIIAVVFLTSTIARRSRDGGRSS